MLKKIYIKRIEKATSLEPWFPAHLQRDIYFSLLHLDQPSSSGKEKKTPAVPESVLKAALLRRATEDIRRVMALRSQKPALAMLLQRGSVGDDLWQRFQRAEKEMEDEVKDVVAEVFFPFFPLNSSFLLDCYEKEWRMNPETKTMLMILILIGKRILPKLGPNNLPVRQRNDQQRTLPRTNGCPPVEAGGREVVVGEEEGCCVGGVHEGVGC